MYHVIFKCTRSERDGDLRASPYYNEAPEPLDCYMVANSVFDDYQEARRYVQSLPHSREGRIAAVQTFTCPKTGGLLSNPVRQVCGHCGGDTLARDPGDNYAIDEPCEFCDDGLEDLE